MISNKQSNPFEKKGKAAKLLTLSISSASYMYIAASHLDKRTQELQIHTPDQQKFC